jgi:hypothetical protein
MGGGSLSVYATNGCGDSPTTSVSNTCRIANPETETKVFPNPTNGKLTVEFSSLAGGKYNVTITDMAGRIMYNEDVTATSGLNQRMIDLETANAGMYMLYLRDSNGDISVHKVTVE